MENYTLCSDGNNKHYAIEPQWNISTKIKNMNIKQNRENKDAGLALLLIILITILLTQNFSLMIPAIIILIVIMTLPQLFYPFAVLWFSMSKILGYISSRVILTFLFFVIVVPIGFVRKILGKDPLKLNNSNKTAVTAFETRNHSYTKTDLQFPY